MTGSRIARISLTVADAARLAGFYQRAFGFERVGEEQRGGSEFAALMGLEDGARAEVIVLRLGAQELELVRFEPAGSPIPATAASNDLSFQHFAIVVTDMRAAFARLQAQPGWRAISRDGPRLLPPTSGGVTAFKFRDPEGHPLELLAFPPNATPPHWRGAAGDGVCLGIDHSAIAVADTAASVAFYTRGLGFTVSGRSLNQGPEQAALDSLRDPTVKVTALTPDRSATPHLELLCYRAPPTGAAASAKRSNDLITTRLIMATSDPAAMARALAASGGSVVSRPFPASNAVLVRDRDDHHVLLTTE